MYIRIDLTQDKRFSLSSSTINLIKSLDDYMYIKVYLDESHEKVHAFQEHSHSNFPKEQIAP